MMQTTETPETPKAKPDTGSLSEPPANQPLISVLVPIYNVEAYLDECLSSLSSQTFTDFEVICINDGSTDGSHQIISKYVDKDARFSVIDKPNSGYGASMNRGLDAARGNYIAILESDDFYSPDTLGLLHKAITEYDAEVARANSLFFWTDRLISEKAFDLVPPAQHGRLVNPRVDHDIFYYPPAVWSALYRNDFLKQNEIRFLETPGASYQDTSFGFKVWANAKRAVFLNERFVYYRQDNQGSSVKSLDKVYCVNDEYAEMDRYLRSRDYPGWLYDIKTRMKFGTYIWNYERLAEEYQLDFLRRMSTEMAEDQANGHLDWQLFDEWTRRDLETILRSPEEYHFQRLAAGRHGRASKALHYLRVGGLPLLFKVIKSKLSR